MLINKVFRIKPFAVASVLLCAVTVILTSFSVRRVDTASAKATVRQQIILDAGHGGFDGGASALDGTLEKDINLEIALKVKEFLSLAGYEVILTRDEDTSTEDTESSSISDRKKSDLRNRLELMKEYPDAIFVSIHMNKFTTSAASGSQVFYRPDDKTSVLLGESIQTSIIENLQHDNTRVNKQATSSTYLLYNATIPAVLVECGFLSNQKDLSNLKDTEYQKKMAFCIFCGIDKYFG